jgi:cytochrome c2
VGPQLNDIIGRRAGGGEILKKHDPSRARWAGLDRRDFGPLS